MAEEMLWPDGDEIKRLYAGRFPNANELAKAATKAGTNEVSESFVLKAMRGERSGKTRLMQIAKALGCELKAIASREPPSPKYPDDPAGADYSAPSAEAGAARPDELFMKAAGRHRIDAKALIGFMAESELTEAALATKAGVSEGTVKRAIDGGEIERDHINRLAKALGIDPAQLLPKAKPLAIATAKVSSSDRPHVEIIIDGPAEKIEAVIKENYAGRIVEDLRGWLLTGGTLLVKIKARSIHIILEMDETDAKRLVTAWERGQLDYLNIVGVRILPPSRWWSDYLGAVFGGIGVISCLLGFFVEAMRAPAAIVAFLSACVGLLSLGRSIYVRLQR